MIRGGGVDAIKREAHEPIVGGVAHELARNGLGSLDSLAGYGDPANGHFVEVNVALRTRAIAVRDVPRLARVELRGRGGGGCVVGMAGAL